MDNSENFEEFRKKYKNFYYNNYQIIDDGSNIILKFEFEIENLCKFNPEIRILKKSMKLKDISSNYAKNMAFNIGLIELISYWKSTCSPNVIIKCGKVSEEQIKWFKKLYFYGLGELFYTNEIKTDMESFMTIISRGSEIILKNEITDEYSGYIIPIGGGKDSVVTASVLNIDTQRDYAFIVNPKEVTLKCAKISGFSDENIVEIYRKIDENLIDLNKKGYINGHTPFSALLAFLSYFTAYLLSKKYISLSNESSANESNVVGESVNHQYSKSYEFECDFRNYAEKYLKVPVKYFSFLRPLNELQIAKIFSKKEKYHKIFRSCNVGSKEKEWKWCNNCAKCLFAYIILSPYMYSENLISIFEEDLFEKENLLEIFIELIGKGNNKPFDCVGTFEEVNFAVSTVIKKLDENNQKLPYLLKYYKENFGSVDISIDITQRYDQNNNLNDEQNQLLRKEVFSND